MGKPLPMALRERVAACVDEGHGHREASRHFRVSPRFVNELMKLRRETGSLAPRRQGHVPGSWGKLAPHAAFVRERMAETGELTLDELRVELEERGVIVHRSSAGRLLHRLGLSHKKNAAGNQVWAMDFVHDQLATGRKIRVLTVVDIFSRFSPAVDPRFSYRGQDVVATLELACRKVGYPTAIRVDQGSEFVSRDLDLWAYQKGVELDFSRPGKPTDNAFIESFNGKFRAECLNAHWFLSLDDARTKMEEWRKDYNTIRPHSAIGNKPPISLMKGSSAAAPP